MSGSTEIQALVNYYARAGYARHIQTVCTEVLRKRAGDPLLQFWKTYGVIMEGSYSEGLRDLEPLMQHRDVVLAAVAASIHAHKQAKIVDDEAVSDLEDRLMNEERNASEHSLLQCATFYWLCGGLEAWRAKGLVERALQMNNNFPEARTLLGWIELTDKGEMDEDDIMSSGPDDEQARIARASQIFDQVVRGEGGNKQLEALMGQVKVLEMSGQIGAAIETLNQVVVSFAWFVPALAEKARLQVATGDWDAALETAQRIQSQDAENIDSMRLTILYLLTREGNLAAAQRKVTQLTEALDRHEPRNAPLFFTISRDVARIAGDNHGMLGVTMQLLERARRLQPENVEYLNELAYQQQLRGEYDTAVQTFRTAAQIDERDGTLDDLSSLYGTIHCQLLNNQLEEAEQQLEFLSDIATERTVKLSYLSALHASKRRFDMETLLHDLDQEIAKYIHDAKRKPFGTDYFVHMEPNIVMGCANLFLSQESGEPKTASEPVSTNVERAMHLLVELASTAPGLLPAQLLLMRTRYAAGDLDAAARTAAGCLRLDEGCADAHIILSQIHLNNGNYKSAASALEQAMSNNFAIRDSPQYHIISAQCLAAEKDNEAALKELELAMGIPGVKSPLTPKQREMMKGKLQVSLQERATVFVLLATTYQELGRKPEAAKTIQDALSEFAGTPEEVRVTIANCELALARGDTNAAMRMLLKIPPESPHYPRAKTALAQVHLKQRNDKAAYIQCYEELADRYQDAKSYAMLAEACMNISEPDKAVAAYERALAINPADIALASKIGHALTITHDFQKAVDYYENARRQTGGAGALRLQMELSELYLKLKRFNEAQECLQMLFNEIGGNEDPNSLSMAVQCTKLLAKVHLGVGDHQSYLQAMLQARQLQSTLITRSRGDPEALHQHQLVASELCYVIAQDYEAHRDHDKAMSFYNEAIKHHEGSIKAIMALAKLHLQRGEVDQCQQQCVMLLREDADNEEAALMLAELMFRKEHYETAIYHFQQLLDKNPRNYLALAQLVHLLRRAGRLDEVARYLRVAERASVQAAHEPGLHFCKGLHARFNNEPHEALAHLNRARKDRDWGPEAVYTMVEVYLNPDNEQIWESEEGGGGGSVGMLSDGMDPRGPLDMAAHIQSASKLLMEIKRRQQPRHKILDAYTLISTKSKPDIDAALGNLLEIVNDDHDNVPALLAMATAFMLLKQTPKARNQLKRVSKLPFNAAEADHFERSWLMLADIHIHGGKYDLAQEMCKKCLKYNKSCAKAWELMGQIMEREQSYKDAAEHYEKAWKFENEQSPAVGFRLAFNYLKAKRFVEAIDVCQKVLKVFPNYPKIQKEILDKARASIRP